MPSVYYPRTTPRGQRTPPVSRLGNHVRTRHEAVPLVSGESAVGIRAHRQYRRESSSEMSVSRNAQVRVGEGRYIVTASATAESTATLVPGWEIIVALMESDGGMSGQLPINQLGPAGTFQAFLEGPAEAEIRVYRVSGQHRRLGVSLSLTDQVSVSWDIEVERVDLLPEEEVTGEPVTEFD